MTKKPAIATAAPLREKSTHAIETFKTLISELKATNDEAQSARDANDAIIASKQQENAAIALIQEQNGKIIQNIENLLSV